MIALLTEIRDLLGYRAVEDVDLIALDESVASCPACNLVEVDLATTGSGHPIYRCKTCEFVWVNTEEARA